MDFNLDLGERTGPGAAAVDRELMTVATSANVACGFHAGDAHAMRAAVTLARELGVAVGAHPGLPDRIGFGRRAMAVTGAEVRNYVTYQAGALAAFLRAAGLELHHVKAHGALYLQTCDDAALARGLVEAVGAFGEMIPIYTLDGSEVWRACEAAGQPVVAELNADRPLRHDASIVLPEFAEAADRRGGEDFQPTPEFVAGQVHDFLTSGRLTAHDGGMVAVRAQTITVHSDGPDAVALARAVRLGAERAGVRLSSEAARPARTPGR